MTLALRKHVLLVDDDLAGAELTLSALLTEDPDVEVDVDGDGEEALDYLFCRGAYEERPPDSPTVILLAGLQGVGKTTTAGKLAQWFKQQGRQPLLVAADLQRPAAVEQLRVLGERAGVEVYSEPLTPLEVARKGVQIATLKGRDVVIIDTAGRLSIDEALMDEVRQISDATSPHYTFLVIDAMTGQDAVHTARAFHDRLSLSGLIVTKLDYDARGGAVLSAQGVVGRPVVFASTGEKLDDFDLFHPERMASRILGMGDVLTLIEEAERKMDADVVGSTAERLMSGQFTLDDFLAQMVQVRKMGSLGSIMKMLPGVGKDLRAAADSVNDKDLNRVEAIIHSMTPAERRDPALINGSRRLRIAQGSGTTVPAVNNLLRQFTEMQKMMKQMASGSMPNLPGGLGKLAGRMPPGAMAGLPGAAGPRPGGSSGGGKKKKKGGRVTPPKNG